LLERSVRALISHPAIDEVVVALPPALVADPPTYLRAQSKPVRIVTGGDRRQDSVALALAVTSDEAELIVVHDASRPFVTADVITRTIDAARESGAALAALPARDTVKLVDAELEPSGRMAATRAAVVRSTVARHSVFLAQTPQVFRRQVLRDAFARGDSAEMTDDAGLVERTGHPVRVVEGDPFNIKITVPEDLVVAEAIARVRESEMFGPGGASVTTCRVGHGYDLHRLIEGRPLVLAGVRIPFDRGLLGHSDADAICHAVTDAVLGAAAAGDIGRYFPDSDPRFEGASSIDLLRLAAGIVRTHGCRIVNVDVTLIAERPTVGPHAQAMCANLADALGITPDRVSVKAKTNEGVDAVGRGEAMAAHAVALIEVV
jgi:2-C-methyl-D-erythritol 2,4-cyclodiphosphate synthase/2-C-methyl-D-erythritol 4-phosphate cytidylyltransferase